ncbi:hypothetical protein O181_032478 [Austropuccinia psidii MF-1]|uniref:Chromo domain-containing protein n=1 Tax=Austropuccinia psidii MF-1 TaxID=1389203 RepID=A0A9Q3D1P1_9BASI|nr:hypothetical protein [Austropuccinia psidii MF-1]
MEIPPPSLPYFPPSTSKDINNPKLASRASSSNQYSRRRGMEVSQILYSKPKRGNLWYLAEWKGFGPDPERSTCKPSESLNNCPEIVKDFYPLYPDKPCHDSSRDLFFMVLGWERNYQN